jgi:hypothetical protein
LLSLRTAWAIALALLTLTVAVALSCTIRRIEQVPTFAPCGKSLIPSKKLVEKAYLLKN